ncbi:hypothetical protein FSP39_006695 [Pinctada imbricata]|uniref:Reverse transcriptase domain-containing protein n=1 Tax=Pinctada imbricata TaxID=66713 RepID=A0AA89C5F4_PINIB|nr:hypothetical protein FSP39_006695 [Pinctada imbricata]
MEIVLLNPKDLATVIEFYAITGTMPPKPRQPRQTKRRRVNSPNNILSVESGPQGITESQVTMSADSQMVAGSTDPQVTGPSDATQPIPSVANVAANIDYEQLAKHIVAQQNKAAISNASNLSETTATEQQGQCSNISLPTSSQEFSASSDTISATNLGTILDSVFAGEPASRSNNEIPIEVSESVPLGATVPNKLKQKIWNNEYVDLKSLLPSTGEEPIAITVKAGKIELNHTSNNKLPLSINQWTDAFLIYGSIYLQKFPTEACNVLKYMFTVREISKLHVDQAWRTYDESFRRIRESTIIPWEKPIAELRLKAAAMGVRQPNKSNTYKAKDVLEQNHPPSPSLVPPLAALPTPINPVKLENELEGYNPLKLDYLIQGLKFGFHLGCSKSPSVHPPHNHKSVYSHPDIIEEYINAGISTNRIKGPFSVPPFHNFKTSPLGVVPKSDPNKFRIIHDLSFPHNDSVNSNIPSEFSQVKYDSIDTVVSLIRKFGKGALMAKSDIKDAFRIIPVSPSDYFLLGFTWKDQFYYERCLPMGASCSCQIFEKLSESLQWIMLEKLNAAGMSHILDDFFFIGPPNSEKCSADLTEFLALCERVNIPINKEKTLQPVTKLIIYGIEVDSVEMMSRLPQDKLDKCRDLLLTFSVRKKVTLRDLQSLIGVLNFACSVVVPGRAFLRRLIDLTIGVTIPHHFIRLTCEARADMSMWLHFLENFNGKSVLFPESWESSDVIRFYTDASGSLGYAAVFGSKWLVGSWFGSMSNLQIAVKELFPIVLSLEIWGNCLCNRKVLFMSDNMAVVQIINKQSSKDKTLMRLVRRLVLTCLRNNIFFKAKHIPGKSNIIADRLSRFQFQEARRLAPFLDKQPTTVPHQLLHI